MPVFYTPLPRNIRLGLANLSGSVFVNNRTRDSCDFRDHRDNADNELVAHLPLQMLIYFNMYFFPFWWVSEVVMLHLKFSMLPNYYQSLLVTGVVLLTIFEILRTYLGYVGNLEEKVPELAGFWLLSFLFQLPILLFFVTDEGILILPLERAVHGIYLLFILAESAASFIALRTMTRKLTLQFHLRQFKDIQGPHAIDMAPIFALPHSRSVLPMPPDRD
ncbi:transmembrane protein 17A [Denticeps clupeoides]|uniref:Transmembrane protein 17A n=1 Tax=Denticeps clupeoides TaxID=299321 RepID=A0AAY4BS53_9TELE|nr:transmembrane protein 17A-like [Denticeps clupeoides]